MKPKVFCVTRVPNNKILGSLSTLVAVRLVRVFVASDELLFLLCRFVNVSTDRRWVLCVVCPCLQKATAKGITFVRVVVKGLGPGRQVSKRVCYPVLGYKLVICISSVLKK